ncbi:MAG: radical SAM protein [Ruminococcaceae bacterium]|nr:radical SAM protein [Oscillospiraceae bacterium]
MSFQRIYVEITNVCNLHCGFCPGTERQPRFLSPGEFDEIVGRLQGWTQYLCFHLMGEPLLHPHLAELLELARRYEYYVNLTTNGILLPDEADKLLDSPALRRVNISLQAWEGNGCAWDVNDYVNSCADFARRAEARGITVSLRLWNGDAAGNGALFSALERTFPPPWGAGQQDFVLSDRIFLEHAKRFDWPDGAGPERGGSFCRGLRHHVGVLCDGTVVPCCLDSEGVLALGNLLEAPLADILDSPRARAMRAGFARRAPAEPLCRRCGYAERFGR